MQLVVNEQATALHVYPGAAPVLEVKRVLHRLQGAKLTPAGVDELLHAVAGADIFSQLEHEGMASFDYKLRDLAAFQIVAFRLEGHTRLEIRKFDDARRSAA